MAWLQVTKGRLAGKIIQLSHEPLLLGREKEWVDEVISTKDIDRFYENVRRGFYANREKEKMAEEAKIHKAVREGRVRRQ